MSNNLDRIVQVNIDIASPAIDRSNFDNLLIFGPGPKTPPETPPRPVGVYSNLAEVTAAGFVTIGAEADPVGVAARIAFSQTPRPNYIFIAVTQEAEAAVDNADIKIITADNYYTDAVGAEEGEPVPSDLPWLQVTYKRRPVSVMEIVIEKDAAVVFGKNLPVTKNSKAYLQVALGESSDPQADQMGLLPEDFAGTYTVTLTGTASERTSSLTGFVDFDGTSGFTPSAVTSTVVPENMTPVELLELAHHTSGWYVACPAGIAETEYQLCAEWTEAHMKLFAYTFLSDTDPVSSVFFRSQGWCGLVTDSQYPEDVPQSNHYNHVAAVARALSFPAGSETWALQRVSAVEPSDLSSSLMKELEDGHSNWIDRRAGRVITMNGQVRCGEWIDVIRGRDWLQNDLQLRIFNLLLMRPKIPYTNPGITLVKNAMFAGLKAAQSRGIVAPDEPISGMSEEEQALLPPEIIDAGIARGFAVSVPNALTLSPSEKASRVLRNCTFVARIAGAIHAVVINGTLTYEIFADL